MLTSFVAAARASRFVIVGIAVALALLGCKALEGGEERERETESEEEHLREPLSASDPIAVGIVIADGVHDTEIAAPCDVFHGTSRHARPGMSVFTVAASTSPVRTAEGLRLLPDHEFDGAPPIDVLVLPSGVDDGGELLEFVRERAERARYVVALGGGAFVLARAGVLTKHSCTTAPDETLELKKRFPELDVQTEMSFVQCGRVITSQGGVRAYDAALYLVELVYGADVAVETGKGLAIEWNLGRVPYVATLDEPSHEEEERERAEREHEEALERDGKPRD